VVDLVGHSWMDSCMSQTSVVGSNARTVGSVSIRLLRRGEGRPNLDRVMGTPVYQARLTWDDY
jgi:hypothetical protein